MVAFSSSRVRRADWARSSARDPRASRPFATNLGLVHEGGGPLQKRLRGEPELVPHRGGGGARVGVGVARAGDDCAERRWRAVCLIDGGGERPRASRADPVVKNWTRAARHRPFSCSRGAELVVAPPPPCRSVRAEALARGHGGDGEDPPGFSTHARRARRRARRADEPGARARARARGDARGRRLRPDRRRARAIPRRRRLGRGRVGLGIPRRVGGRRRVPPHARGRRRRARGNRAKAPHAREHRPGRRRVRRQVQQSPRDGARVGGRRRRRRGGGRERRERRRERRRRGR